MNYEFPCCRHHPSTLFFSQREFRREFRHEKRCLILNYELWNVLAAHELTRIYTNLARRYARAGQRLLSVIKRFLSNTFCLMVLVIRRKSLTSQQKDKTIFNMTQIILNIEDKSLLPGLRKILSNLNGVTIAKTTTTRKGTLSRAVEEVRNGKLTKVNSVTELMEELDAWSTAFYLPINLSVHTRNAWNVVVTRLCSKRLLPYCLLLVHYLHAIILTS